MSEATDEQLMAALAAGRASAVGEIFARYRRPLISFFMRHGADEAGAEDSLQEVFLRILKYHESYDSTRVFRSWLFRIAHRVAMDRVTRPAHAAREVQVGFELPEGRGGSDQPDPLEELERDRRRARVHAALGRLGEGDRNVLLLAKVRELRYADVAEIMECSEGAVKVRVHRALRRLADQLAGEEKSEGSGDE